MNSFIKNKIFDNGSDKSKIGSVCVENIELNELDIENYLVEYILNEDTLKYIFCNHSPTKRQIKQMYKRFTPPDDIDTEDFISSNSDKKSFYSFLAEGILPIVYKDLYGYSLEYASIDLNQTCSDTNSGIDVCMTNRDSSLFVIGEAKFYKDFQNGMDTIIANFSEDKSLFNKLESLFKHVDNVDELNPIIVKFLNKRECDEIYLKDFLK